MKITKQDSVYQFFLELPPADYLNDIEIQDEYEKSTESSMRGLSDEQVSQIAIDSLKEAKFPSQSDNIAANDKPIGEN